MLNNQEYPNFANFTIEIVGNETGHSLECIELYGKCINKSETQHMLRGNNATTSLNRLWKNLYSVKCNYKSNMNVFRLSMGKYLVGLYYFELFICNIIK